MFKRKVYDNDRKGTLVWVNEQDKDQSRD